ncbi:dihydroorotase [Pelagophyceae sp. CCMP2097]|nr:dihydroorotase [Pelagophyceae sp. CCMP2097]
MAALVDSLTLVQPDDMHHHLRDGAALKTTVPFCAREFGRCIVMPNLKPPVTTTAAAALYRERIVAQLPADSQLQPLMTLYLTDATSREEIRAAKASGIVFAVKYYPAGATTNSDAGVTSIDNVRQPLEEMALVGLPLLLHGEVARDDVDIFDREKTFVQTTAAQIVREHPNLKVVLEHVTTSDAALFVLSCGPNVAATVTPQHLLYNRNMLLAGGLKPHYYCMPILKAEHHRLALVKAVTSGSPKFFLGTDSAPHEVLSKHSACGCAGCFSAHAALELYAEVFDSAGALDKLEAFSSFHGADFYGLPRNTKRVNLRRQTWQPPAAYAFGDGGAVVPLRAKEDVLWTLEAV